MSDAKPTQSIAGVEIPNTPTVNEAIAFAREHSNDALYNHLMRTCLFGFIIAKKIPPMQGRDQEAHVVAAFLHDLGLDPKGKFASDDKRFEVDGAIAARKFLNEKSPNWDEHRVQLVWDAIALHTSPSIAKYKQAEIGAMGLGVLADLLGPNGVPEGLLSWEEYKPIVKEFPRLQFYEYMSGHLCGLCRTKPTTTYDTFMSDWGAKYVPDYQLDGNKTIDWMEPASRALDAM